MTQPTTISYVFMIRSSKNLKNKTKQRDDFDFDIPVRVGYPPLKDMFKKQQHIFITNYSYTVSYGMYVCMFERSFTARGRFILSKKSLSSKIRTSNEKECSLEVNTPFVYLQSVTSHE